MKKIIGLFALLSAPAMSDSIGYWHFDEGAGNYTWDSSPSGIVTQLGKGESRPNWTARSFDSAALNFNGNQFLKIPDNRVLEPQKLTVEARIKGINNQSIHSYVVSKSPNGCAWSAYALYFDASGLRFYIGGQSNLIKSPAAGFAMLDGNWHHIAGTYDGLSIRLYVDGVEVGGGTPAAGSIVYSNFHKSDLFIGNASDGGSACQSGYKGDIDEVRVWSRVLNINEIQSRASSQN